jgi:hypothetical protein
MWKRLRRTTFAPRRPLILPEQWGIVLVTVVAVVVSAIFLARAL